MADERDQHVNELIARWFFGRLDRRIVFLNRSPPSSPFARNLLSIATRSTTGSAQFIEGPTKERLSAAIEAAGAPIVLEEA